MEPKEVLLRREWNKDTASRAHLYLLQSNHLAASQLLADVQYSRAEVEAIGDVFFVDVTDPISHTSLLILAAGLNNVPLVCLLIEMGAAVDAANSFGHTALTWACILGHCEVVQVLLLRGASTSHKTMEGRTALHLACLYVHDDIVHALFRHWIRGFFSHETSAAECLRNARWLSYANLVSSYIQEVDRVNCTPHELLYILPRDLEGPGDLRSPLFCQPVSATQPRLVRRASCKLARSPSSKSQAILQRAPTLRNIEVKSLAAVQKIEVLFTELTEVIRGWRKYAQDEEYRARPMPCWLGCGFAGDTETLASHVGKDCISRITKCEACAELVVAHQVPTHLASTCKFRKCKCPNATDGCTAEFLFSDMSKHLRLICPAHKVDCSWLCGKSIAFSKIAAHETVHCKNRISECSLCHESVVARDVPVHMREVCSQRIVSCSVGCGGSFIVSDLPAHIDKICRIPCKWGCGSVLGPMSVRALHETSSCPNRRADCRHNCGAPGLCVGTVAEHESECVMRVTVCSLCGEGVAMKDSERHIDIWRGDCANRCVYCPYNLVGRRIRLGTEGVVLRHRQLPSAPPAAEGSAEGMQLYVRFEDCMSWVDYWHPELMLLGGSSSSLKCGMIARSHLRRHVDCECPHRPVIIEAMNGVSDRGQSSKCGRIHELVDLQKQFYLFQQDPSPPSACPHCSEELSVDDLAEHLKYSCLAVMKRCSLGCGSVVARGSMSAHVQRECAKRVWVCQLCGESMWAEESNTHGSSVCAERSVECELECATTGLTASSLLCHRENDCPNRSVCCSQCREPIALAQKSFHDAAECSAKLSLCPQGCGEKVLISAMENHIKNTCVNKHVFYGRITTCPIGCGAIMKHKDVIEHVSYVCEHRLITCPNHCGVAVRFNCLAIHLVFCPLRVVTCNSNKLCCRVRLCDFFFATEKPALSTMSFSPENRTSADNLMITGGSDTSQVRDLTLTAPYVQESGRLYSAPSSLMLTNNGFNYDDSFRNFSREKAQSLEENALSRERVSSVCQVGGLVDFRPKLRMCQCDKHGATALISAVRASDFGLAVHIIKRVKNAEDFDLETYIGETALTIACRSSKFDFIQLLLEHGASVNYETKSGRTALIEAVHANSYMTVDELVKYGASVSQKSSKHNLSAIEWARKYKDENVLRVLEFGLAVEVQMVKMFRDISCGNIESIQEYVRGGEPFKAGTEPRYHDELRMSMEQHIHAKKLVEESQGRVKEASEAASQSIAKADASAARLKDHEHAYTVAKAKKDAIYAQISNDMEGFYSKVKTLQSADVYDIIQQKRPTPSIKIATLAYGLLFNSLLHYNKYSFEGQDYKSWWSSVIDSMRNSSSVIQRLKIFQIKMFIQSALMDSIDVFHDLYTSLTVAISEEIDHSLPVQSSYVPTSDRGEALKSKTRLPLLEMLVSLKFNNVVYDSDDDEVLESGKWVRGKWVHPSSTSAKVSAPQGDTPSVVTVASSVIESDVTFRFVEVMHLLLGTLSMIAAQRPEVVEANRQIQLTHAAYLDLSEVDSDVQQEMRNIVDFRNKKEKQLVYRLKHAKSMDCDVESNLARLKIARLMNMISSTGYTAVAWAAAFGFYSAVDVLISHGAPVGFNDDMYQMAAASIQLTYRIYRVQCGRSSAIVNKFYSESQSAMEKISQFRLHREHNINRFRLLRSRLKLPIAEAAFNGKWEIVDLIVKKGMFHCYFSYCWNLPIPLPPRRMPVREYKGDVLHMLNLVAYGMNEQYCGELVNGVGWVGPDHEKGAYGETMETLGAIWSSVMKARDAFVAKRTRKRLIVNKLKKQAYGDKEMVKAILERDMKLCMSLARDWSSSIDFETTTGFTPLIAAAEENVIGPDHPYIRYDDGRECLLVEYLLDREQYRPSIDYETESGLTALIHACSLNRFLVAQALLDRGADVNYQNKFKKSAIHYAVSIGSAQCVKLLVERGADTNQVDDAGMTALDIAYSKGLAQVILVISRISAGNLGPLTYQRGVIETTVLCPLGCGGKVFKEMLTEHCSDCVMRVVSCDDCLQSMLACDLKAHLEESCKRRLIKCEACEVEYHFNEEKQHKTLLCELRLQPCPNSCGELRQDRDMRLHLPHCTWRVVPCSLKCSESNLRMKDSFNHLKYDCEHRRVSCSLECGSKVMAKEVIYHMKNICANRPASCKWCSESVRQIDKAMHEKTCSMMCYPCSYKCGDFISKHIEQNHIKNECKHRFVKCPLHCALAEVRAVDLDKHVLELCECRLRECLLGCRDPCTESIRVLEHRLMDVHVKFECSERFFRCDACRQEVKVKLRESHLMSDCPQRRVSCRLHNCIKVLPICDREDHERFLCRFRVVLCPLGCGEALPCNHVNRHQLKHCPKRLVDCPLKCNLSIHYESLELHIRSDCKFRVLSDEAKRNLAYGLKLP